MRDQINLWRTLRYRDPAIVLTELRAIEIETAELPMDERVRRLRTPGLKTYREAREAALFTYGLTQGKGTPMFYSPFEHGDYDFVVTGVAEEAQHFCPVQLKELVPAHLNPLASLADLLARLPVNRPPSRTVLAVKWNRRETEDLRTLALPALPYQQVWFFWAASEVGEKWGLYGDALGDPGFFSTNTRE